MKLFCLPYAGGSAIIYRNWPQHLHTSFQLVAIELAGRGRKIHESLYNSMDEVIEDVFASIKFDIQEGPYALFGHSMGALICFELANRIRKENLPPPSHIFFSGSNAPHVNHSSKMYHLMDDEKFRDSLIELGGTPPDFFKLPELTALFLPMLRNDFKIAETYTYKGEIEPFDCDITIFSGKEEEFDSEELIEWKVHTHQICSIHIYPGDHFFINTEYPRMIKHINTVLMESLTSMHFPYES